MVMGNGLHQHFRKTPPSCQKCPGLAMIETKFFLLKTTDAKFGAFGCQNNVVLFEPGIDHQHSHIMDQPGGERFAAKMSRTNRAYRFGCGRGGR
jgi:hypothetical protein